MGWDGSILPASDPDGDVGGFISGETGEFASFLVDAVGGEFVYVLTCDIKVLP